MKLFVLVYKEHYEKYRELHNLKESTQSLQLFLKEIGTPLLSVGLPRVPPESNYVYYQEVPDGSCIRVLQPYEYVAVIHAKLFVTSRENQDKSRRGSSCVVI